MGQFNKYVTKVIDERNTDTNKNNSEYLIESIEKYNKCEETAYEDQINKSNIGLILRILKMLVVLFSIMEAGMLINKNSLIWKISYLLTNFLSFLTIHMFEIHNDIAQFCNEFLQKAYNNMQRFYEANLVYVNQLLTDEELKEIEKSLDANLMDLAHEYDSYEEDMEDEDEKVLRKG